MLMMAMGDGVREDHVKNYRMMTDDLGDGASGVDWHKYESQVSSIHPNVLVQADYGGKDAA